MTREELRQTLVLANEFKEGDLLVGGTTDDGVRAEARGMLLGIDLDTLTDGLLVEDGLSESLARSRNRRLGAEIARLRVADVKRILFGPRGPGWAEAYRDGLSSEAIAALVKTMTNGELSAVAQSLFNPLPGDGTTPGSPTHFGSRIQPNSPGDDEGEILFSILEGLSYGCGDVILGVNPASDDLDTIVRLEDLLRSVVERLALPTRYCVLSDIVKQTSARSRTVVDVGFQSLAGTSRALVGMAGLDVEGLLDLARGFDGLYFETGQGSAVTNGSAEGVDMVTLESRAYGLARYLRQQTGAWTIVNDVAGFIGPEVFRTADQLLRACLEDSVMAKLHGLTMGLDVCATFHMGISPRELRALTAQVVDQAAPTYLMAVAGNADPMLGYLTTSFREHPMLRRRTGRRMTSAMQQRLTQLRVMDGTGEPVSRSRGTARLYGVYQQAGGDRRSAAALEEEADRRLTALRRKGYDLGYEWRDDPDAAQPSDARLDRIYENARASLYATLRADVVRHVSPDHLRVGTRALNRDDYLAHPPSGELIREDDVRRLRTSSSRHDHLLFVISDGLNADAVNENLGAVLPTLRRQLANAGFHVAQPDVVIDNGRVRAGYHVGVLLDPEATVHFIGERPGTGINSMSTYLTYGRDPAGQSRWRQDLDHSCTTAICGIHRQGKHPETAAREICGCVVRMFERRCSGVALGRA